MTSESYAEFEPALVAVTCIKLSSTVEESVIKLDDLINVAASPCTESTDLTDCQLADFNHSLILVIKFSCVSSMCCRLCILNFLYSMPSTPSSDSWKRFQTVSLEFCG